MADLKAHLERNLVQAEQLGQADRAKKIKVRLAELDAPEPEELSLSNSKAELVEAAEAAGVEVDGLTKIELLEALEN